MYISVSLLLLLILIIYRRYQNKSNENQEQEQTGETFEENLHTREPSEYRLSVAQALPTITEENPNTLSPIKFNQNNFPELSNSTSATSPFILEKIF